MGRKDSIRFFLLPFWFRVLIAMQRDMPASKGKLWWISNVPTTSCARMGATKSRRETRKPQKLVHARGNFFVWPQKSKMKTNNEGKVASGRVGDGKSLTGTVIVERCVPEICLLPAATVSYVCHFVFFRHPVSTPTSSQKRTHDSQ